MTIDVKEYADERLGERYYRIEHKSGLKIFVFPKERHSSMAMLVTDFGSIDNCFYSPDDEKYVRVPDGVAHFLEHKMFDNPGGESVDEIFSKLGSDVNAMTSWEETAYFFSASDKLYENLKELIRFVYSPYFTKESIEKEQGIIGQEILMGEDDPSDRCFLNLACGLYERSAVRRDVAGTQSSISRITPKLLYKCHRIFYNPANMALIVCGADADVKKVVDTVDEGFEKLGIGEPIRIGRKYPKERISAYKPKVVCERHVERPMFCIGFKDSKAPSDPLERRKRQISAAILTGLIFTASGELYTDLFKRGIMTTPFNYDEEYGKNFAFCYAGGECDDPDVVYAEVLKYIEKLRTDGIPADKFERRRKMLYASDIKMYDSVWNIANALYDNAFLGIDLFTDSELVKNTKKEDVEKLLSEVFRKGRMTLSVVKPYSK